MVLSTGGAKSSIYWGSFKRSIYCSTGGGGGGGGGLQEFYLLGARGASRVLSTGGASRVLSTGGASRVGQDKRSSIYWGSFRVLRRFNRGRGSPWGVGNSPKMFAKNTRLVLDHLCISTKRNLKMTGLLLLLLLLLLLCVQLLKFPKYTAS